MSQYEQKDNSGSMFKNNRKEEGSNQADRTGSAKILCPHCGQVSDHWVSGWVKQSAKVGAWLSLAFKPKDQPGMRVNKMTAAQDMDDEVPF